MSRPVRIAAFSAHPPSVSQIPNGMAAEDYMIGVLDRWIANVLPDTPDLIVLPECCDRPSGLSAEQCIAYYSTRGNRVLDHLRITARENRCYIAYSAVRNLPDGTRRNCVTMIDREGHEIGRYDKNYPVVTEIDDVGILPGDGIAIFDCDFGRVGALICFDLNFEMLRQEYKAAHPDIVLFSSNFGGGLMRNFFAFDVGCHFVSSCGYGCPAEFISPLGVSLAASSNHYSYLIHEINLDCAVVHLDFNWEKIRAARTKYGKALTVSDPGYIGVILLTYEGDDQAVTDILREFDITPADAYFAHSRNARDAALRSKPHHPT